MAAPAFAPILDRAPSTIQKPKPLAVGTYTTLVQGLPRYDKSSKKQTDFVEFTHKFLSAGDEVDEEALTEALTAPDGNVRSLQDVTMPNTYYLTENAAWRLIDFLRHCGFDVDNDEQTPREMIEHTPGCTVGVVVHHEAAQDGQTFFARIGKTFAIEQ